jgi:hypothetical protein
MRFFFFVTAFMPAHTSSCPTGTGGSFRGVKRPVREAYHSSPSRAEVKNAWSYTSTPQIRVHGVVPVAQPSPYHIPYNFLSFCVSFPLHQPVLSTYQREFSAFVFSSRVCFSRNRRPIAILIVVTWV